MGCFCVMFLMAKVPKVSFRFTVVWPLSWTNLEVHLGAWVRIGESQEETFKKCGPVRCLLMVEGRSSKGLVGTHSLLLPGDAVNDFVLVMCCLATCPMAWNQMDWKLQNCEQTPNFLFISWSSLVLCYSDAKLTSTMLYLHAYTPNLHAWDCASYV